MCTGANRWDMGNYDEGAETPWPDWKMVPLETFQARHSWKVPVMISWWFISIANEDFPACPFSFAKGMWSSKRMWRELSHCQYGLDWKINRQSSLKLFESVLKCWAAWAHVHRPSDPPEKLAYHHLCTTAIHITNTPHRCAQGLRSFSSPSFSRSSFSSFATSLSLSSKLHSDANWWDDLVLAAGIRWWNSYFRHGFSWYSQWYRSHLLNQLFSEFPLNMQFSTWYVT